MWNDRIKGKIDVLANELSGVFSSFPPDEVNFAINSIVEPTPYSYIPKSVNERFSEILHRHGDRLLGKYKKYIILNLIEELDQKISAKNLPTSITNLYPDTIDFLLRDIFTIDDSIYLVDHESLVRELRLASGRSLPGGGQRIIDENTYLLRSIYRNNGYINNLKCFFFIYFRLGGLAPLYRVHIEPRYPYAFNEDGRISCYLRIAELLRINPSVRGVAGTSWYFDPEVANISPKLAYLRMLPEKNGAFFRHDGSGPDYVEWATAKSKTRRELYEKGKYVPTCYTMIWARKDLLRWAEAKESGAVI